MATYNPTDPIAGDSRGSPEAWIAHFRANGAKRMDQVERYVREVYRLAVPAGIGAHKGLAQFVHETDGATSDAWNGSLNPAGIGVTDDSRRNWYDFEIGENAARAHLVHLALYVFGDLPDVLKPYRDTDPRASAVGPSILGQRKTLASFSGSTPQNLTWAVDPDYGEKWANTLNRLEPVFATDAPPAPSQPSSPPKEKPVALNFDPSLTPFPPYEERFALAKRDGHGQDNFGTRTLRGNVWHRGLTKKQTLDQAVSYLIAASTAGLTDGYIDNKTGRLVMMNPMKTLFSLPAWWEDRAGWANGVYGKGRAPSEDARAFVARFGGQIGANIINQDLESYELLGEYEDPISEAAKQTMVAIAANRAQRMKIPYDVWPLNPATGTVVHFGHREFTLKECPGEVVWDFINGEMVTRVREVLRKAQTGSAGAPIPAPQPTPSPVPTPVPDGALGIMADLFGKIDGYGYDPQGVITKYWLAEGAKSGEYPALVKVRKDGPTRSFIFSNGMVLQNEIGTGKIWRMTHATELAAVLVDVLAG